MARPAPGGLGIARAEPRNAADRAGGGLETVGLTVRYGAVVANDAVSLTVAPGAVVGLIGPNGAGKTTFIDAVTGFAPASGQVLLDGARIDHLPPQRRARRGLGRTWQSLELFGELTVWENAAVATPRRGDAAATRALEIVGLAPVAGRYPGELSLGQQKLVGVARALAGEPSVLLLDEPAAGLDAEESAALGARLREVAGRGIAVLLVDHDMGLVLKVCDELVVLEVGRVIAAGPPAVVRRDDAVLQAYLGTPE